MIRMYTPDKINLNFDFIKSNYLTTCLNKNLKTTIINIYARSSSERSRYNTSLILQV
jgi:hypothetical protein